MAARRPRRECKGRQKLEMVKMKNESNLLVTFSKRHHGIGKKLHELYTLTGANGVVIGFSPRNKPFSFGCPNVSSILDKFQQDFVAHPSTTHFSGLDNPQNYSWGTGKIMSLEEQIREEKRRGEIIDARITQRQKHWWEVPIEDLTLEQLEKYLKDLQSLGGELSKGMDNNPEAPYFSTNDFVFPQYATAAFPSSINGGKFVSGDSSSAIDLNQMTDLNPMGIPSATAGTLKFVPGGCSNETADLNPMGIQSEIADILKFVGRDWLNQTTDMNTMGIQSATAGTLEILAGGYSNQTTYLNPMEIQSATAGTPKFVAGSSSNQMDDLNPMEIQSEAAGTSEFGASDSSNQTANLNPMEIQSSTAGTLEFAGPSRINTNVQPIIGEKSSADLHEIHSLLAYFHDDSQFLNLLLD